MHEFKVILQATIINMGTTHLKLYRSDFIDDVTINNQTRYAKRYMRGHPEHLLLSFLLLNTPLPKKRPPPG